MNLLDNKNNYEPPSIHKCIIGVIYIDGIDSLSHNNYICIISKLWILLLRVIFFIG